MKPASKGEEICGPFKADDESSNKAEKVTRGESCNVLKEKSTKKKETKKKRKKERSYEEYKGFEKVVKNKEPAGEAGLCKEIFDQPKVDGVEFNQKEKVDVTGKKYGREKFDKEFARNGHLVGKLMHKVEKNNKKMEKLGRSKEGFAPIGSDGKQWFDAPSDLPKATSESTSSDGGQSGVETKQGGCARREVKKAEVE